MRQSLPLPRNCDPKNGSSLQSTEQRWSDWCCKAVNLAGTVLSHPAGNQHRVLVFTGHHSTYPAVERKSKKGMRFAGFIFPAFFFGGDKGMSRDGLFWRELRSKVFITDKNVGMDKESNVVVERLEEILRKSKYIIRKVSAKCSNTYVITIACIYKCQIRENWMSGVGTLIVGECWLSKREYRGCWLYDIVSHRNASNFVHDSLPAEPRTDSVQTAKAACPRDGGTCSALHKYFEVLRNLIFLIFIYHGITCLEFGRRLKRYASYFL